MRAHENGRDSDCCRICFRHDCDTFVLASEIYHNPEQFIYH